MIVARLRFAGRYTDPNTGLQYDQARYYDPTTGQFVTVDPLVAQTQQPYQYGGDDPINGTDPTGLFCLSLHCISDTVGAATGFVAQHWQQGLAICTVTMFWNGVGEACGVASTAVGVFDTVHAAVNGDWGTAALDGTATIIGFGGGKLVGLGKGWIESGVDDLGTGFRGSLVGAAKVGAGTDIALGGAALNGLSALLPYAPSGASCGL